MSSASRDFWDRQWAERLHGMANTSAYNLIRREDVAGRSILDVGCGDARLSKLAELAGKFTGVDISINALRGGRKNRLCVCDASNLPFRPDTFDSVFSIDTLTLLGDGCYEALREMRRVTRNMLIFNVSHSDFPRTDLALDIKLNIVTLIDNGPYTILKTRDMPDRAFFDENGICIMLRELDLIPKGITILTANDERNLGLPIWEQRKDPEMNFKQKIFIMAMKRS